MVGPTFSFAFSRYDGQVKCNKTGEPLKKGVEIKYVSGDCHGRCIPNDFQIFCPIHKEYERVEEIKIGM